MAFTARIGFPEPRVQSVVQKQAAEQSSIRFRYVLQAALQRSGAWTWTSIAVADTPDELEKYFKAWLGVDNNRQVFSGQTRLELVPDIS